MVRCGKRSALPDMKWDNGNTPLQLACLCPVIASSPWTFVALDIQPSMKK